MDQLAKSTMIELRNLINDLKIYFIGQPLNDPLIRPWSVVGRYVRRCIIIYEKMSFDKLVLLVKQSSVQFKHLSAQISKNRLSIFISTSKLHNTTKNPSNQTNLENQIDQNYEIDTYQGNHSNSPMSGALFLNDESNLTITGEYLNRSTNPDCSGMDLDESLTHQHGVLNSYNNNKEFVHKFYSQSIFNPKALTSTVSAQRTHSMSNFKPQATITDSIEKPVKVSNKTAKISASTVTFSLTTAQTLSSEPLIKAVANPVSELNAMPPPTAMPALHLTTAAHVEEAPVAAFALKNGCAFSRKIAEYFVAQQANLIENNEHDAMNPIEIQYKIDELLAYDSNFADAYYLKYLNYLRLRDYPSALKALHDYFDRAIFAGSVSLAALNLCSLEYRFDNK